MKAVLLIYIFFSSSIAFSQIGTYELKTVPIEALDLLENSEGVLEFPIYIGTSTIKLKSRKRVTITHDNGKDTEKIVTGNWSKEGEIIRLSVEIESKIEIIEFTIVQYESGIYLKSLNSIQFYKKQ